MTEQQKHRGRITEKCLEHGKKYLKENKEKSEEDKKNQKNVRKLKFLACPRIITTPSRTKHRTISKNLRNIKKLRG